MKWLWYSTVVQHLHHKKNRVFPLDLKRKKNKYSLRPKENKNKCLLWRKQQSMLRPAAAVTTLELLTNSPRLAMGVCGGIVS